MWVEKHNRWIEKNSVRVFVLVSASLCFTGPAAAQCAGKTGFALQACNVAAVTGGNTSNAGIPPASLAGGKGEPMLSSGLADSITGADTLPGSVDPDLKLFSSLLKLERVDDGAFILKTGMYEAYLQGFSLDANDGGGNRTLGGWVPAPIHGKRGEVVASILKNAELHPDISQGDIQNLLWAVVAGTDLEKMPQNLQQAAVRLLPADLAKSLQGPVEAEKAKQSILGAINNRIKKSPLASGAAGAAGGVATVLNPGPARSSLPPMPAGLGYERGKWVLMPGGFYLRYLPDGASKIRVELLVPEAVGNATTHPALFDPPEWVLVYAGSPPLRLGISLRVAK
jgi:hypothetical protein